MCNSDCSYNLWVVNKTNYHSERRLQWSHKHVAIYIYIYINVFKRLHLDMATRLRAGRPEFDILQCNIL
jgi:hypothetical protein